MESYFIYLEITQWLKLLPHVWVGLRECFACGWSCLCVFLPLVLWPYWHSACWLVRHGSGVGVLWVLIRCPVCTLSFPRPPSHWHHFYHSGDLCNTIFLSFSFSTLLSGSLSYIFNVYMIFTSLVSCLSIVCLLCLTVLFLLMFTSSTCFLSILSCFFSLTVLNY